MEPIDAGIKLTQLVIAVAGFVGLIWTIRQKTISDNRAEWWKRYTWSVENTVHTSDELQEVAWRNLEGLTQSALVTRTEAHLVQDLAIKLFQEHNEGLEQEGSEND